MLIFRKLDPHFFERNREIINSLVNSVGFVVFFFFGINAIMAHRKENKDGPHTNSQFSFVVCAGAVAMQMLFLYIKTMWNLENTVSKVALTSVSFETVGFFVLSYVINIEEKYQNYLALAQSIIPAFVFGGVISLLAPEEPKKGLNQVEKCHIDNAKTDDRIKLLEVKKIKLELELLELKKENEKLVVKLKETQESTEDKIKAFTTSHSLQAEKLRKAEEEALRMKAEIRALKELREYDFSKWEKNVETIAVLTYKNERRDAEINKIEKICVDLRKNLGDLRKNSFALQGDGEKAFHDAEQALIHSLLILQQQC